MKTAVILAGERSGDLIGAEICYYLKDSGFQIFGVGGEGMLACGLDESFFPISEISVMGFAEVIPKILAIKKRINQTVEQILKINPDFVLTIDAPGFNTRVVKKLRKNFKGKIYHAVAPTVWAYKEGRAKVFAKLYDKLFCILPFEPPYFTKEGLDAKFISYPPLNRLQEEIKDATNYKKEYILFSLGSREGEVFKHLNFAQEVVEIIREKIPNVQFAFPTFKRFEDIIKSKFPRDVVEANEENKLKLYKQSKFAICKSGTGAVEAALFEIPSVIFYKVNWISYFIIKLLAKIKRVNLINIILQAGVIPEFIQHKANPQNVADKVIEMLQNKTQTLEQVNQIKKAIKKLESPNYKSFSDGVFKNIINDL